MALILKTYKLKQNFSAPNINSTRGKNFTKKSFVAGQEIMGTPFEDCLLVYDTYLIPMSFLEVAQEVRSSNYDGDINDLTKIDLNTANVRKEGKRYTNGFLWGAVGGFLLAFYCVHKGWVQPSLKNKVLITLGGAMVGGYAATKSK